MANDKRLIDANELITTIQGTASEVAKNAPYVPEWFTRLAARQVEILYLIDKQPTVDAVEVVHGRWRIETDEEEPNPMFKLVVCSACKEKANDTYNYCPNCGAKMDGDGNG